MVEVTNPSTNQRPMNLEKLLHVLSAMHPLSDEFKGALENHFMHLSLPKNHLLLEAPKVSDHAYFLDNGFAMSFTFVNGKKRVGRFWKEGQVILSAKSFFERKPSQEFIQLVQQSDVLCISRESVLELFAHHQEAIVLYWIIMNKYYELMRERHHDLQYLNAVERYKKLRRTFPKIEQLIPSKQIASYLGMDPHTLSRVKRKNGGT
jgi:CRP/FNR family transcriptional regulator, anaerobic regulatory protein